MSLELVLFIIVAAVAIFSAAFMLVSRNAVHSALFLVLNFACVAFFYLMLNAPFLAMIQITVYAGAIMVLFMFVIMLLGADKLGQESVNYGWLAPAAALLTAVFLVVALTVVVQGNVGLLKPVPHDPQLRIVHALPGVAPLDIYLNDTKALSTVTYTQASDFATVPAGDYVINVFPACVSSDLTRCADPVLSKAKPLASTRVTLAPESATTFVVTGNPGAPQALAVPRLLAVTTVLTTLDDERTFRLQAVNSLPGSQTVNLVQVNPVDASVTQPLFPDLASGQVSDVMVLPTASYNLVWTRGDERIGPIADLVPRAKTSELLILTQEPIAGGPARQTTIRVDPAAIDESFGSPQAIGVGLLSTFLLPFELVSLLLLAAMVGAILLTREDVVKRVRARAKVSEGALRVNRAVIAQAAQQNLQAGSPSNIESSAD